MKKTKIVCTLGPATASVEIMKKMIKAGMNVARFNMSHGTHESHLELINNLKRARAELGVPVAIMIDLKGPEIRIRQFENGSIMLQRGARFILTTKNMVGTNEYVSVNYSRFPKVVTKGTRILLNDGFVELKVIDVNNDSVLTEVVVGGQLSNNKSINLPDVHVEMDFLSSMDKADLDFAKYVQADIISLSFVSSAKDVLDARKYLDKIGFNDAIIISKIENKFGVNDIDEILAVSDGIMVARGDMGVEINYEKIPAIQKNLIALCKKHGKISITATQMLESMMYSPRPTRAEISDVANACLDGSTCVMLSGETSAGNYPVESIIAMGKIIEDCEKELLNPVENLKCENQSVNTAIGLAACDLSQSLNTSSILVVTKSGEAANSVSRFRPTATIIACTPSERVYYKLAALWGVVPIMDKEFNSIDELLASSKQKALATKLVKKGELFVEVAGVKAGESGINFVRVEKY